MDEAEARRDARQKYKAEIERLWTHKPDTCPVCGSDWWVVGDLVDTPLRALTPELTAMREREVNVYAPLSCLLCGYTIFFHTGVLDIRAQEEIKSKGPIYGPNSPYRKDDDQ